MNKNKIITFPTPVMTSGVGEGNYSLSKYNYNSHIISEVNYND